MSQRQPRPQRNQLAPPDHAFDEFQLPTVKEFLDRNPEDIAPEDVSKFKCFESRTHHGLTPADSAAAILEKRCAKTHGGVGSKRVKCQEKNEFKRQLYQELKDMDEQQKHKE
ncbi:hypothetical protein RCL1_004420 [Eukaryota sp. TZLM3-RCL]